MDSDNHSQLQPILAERLNAVEGRINAACHRAGRSRAEVTLVAVTKTLSAETAALLPSLGILDLGESRPQELWRKAAHLCEVGASVRWHQVGHLQRNKIEATLPLVHLIHSVDSVRLLTALENEAATQQRTVAVLLEVNVSREASKHGFSPQEVTNLVGPITGLNHVRVTGLMTMAPLEADIDECRRVFAELRRLREHCWARFPPPHDLNHLSMGMTNDFEAAIEEGATHVRLGTVLFEGLN
jgi:pyridoxal phosphate enzyme (YggS family)